MAGAIHYVFERVEKKYILTTDKYEAFLKAIDTYMSRDEYGEYTIGNIYYDTASYDLISRSIEKPKYKEKLRLRSYGIPEKQDKVYIELKKKYKGTVFKRRISLTLEEAEAYLNRGVRPKEDSQILRELDYFIHFYKPIPKVYIAYDRIAYFGKADKSIRITFDCNIRSRQYDLSLGAGDEGRLALEEGLHLMEIKVAGALPLWLTSLLSDLQIYPTSFSKYGTVYKQFILSNREDSLCLQAY